MVILLNFIIFVLIFGGVFLWFVGTNEEVKKKTIEREVKEGHDREWITVELNKLRDKCYFMGGLSVFIGIGLIIARIFA